MREPKTRPCISCRIRHATAHMEQIEKVWYCQPCASKVTGSTKWTAPMYDYELNLDE